MDEERDIKPFLYPITATPIQRSLLATVVPPERGGAPASAVARPQSTQAPPACVLNRAASELSGDGVGDRITGGAGEALENEGALATRPLPAPRFSRKFWSAGDYGAAAAAGSSAPQHPSMYGIMLSISCKFC